MKQKLLLLIIILTCLAGCAPYIETKPDGTMTVSSYALKGSKTLPDGTKLEWNMGPEVPERWFSNVPKYLIDNFASMADAIGKLRPPAPPPPLPPPPPAPAPVPQPTPTPYPAPVPTPVPTPTPPPVPVPVSKVFTLTGNVITLDMNTLPRSMGLAGFEGTDGGLYYFAATIYAWGPGVSLPQVSDLAALHGKKQQFYDWFDAEVMKVHAMLKANPSLTMVTISNDGKGPDKLGFRLGPPIMRRLSEFGGRVTLGTVVPESEYSHSK